MSTVHQLKAAKALIDTPEKWTKYVFARDAAGERVYYAVQSAVCFCMEGALARADAEPAAYGVMNSVIRRHMSNRMDIAGFNDRRETTHEDVMKVFDEAIAVAGGTS